VSAQADEELSPERRRWVIGIGVLRALGTTTALVVLYYVLPLDHLKNVPVVLTAAVVILGAVVSLQLRAVVKSRHPALRAIEALAATVPLFLLLFASAYFTMANSNPANFSAHPLTRSDTLYFTVTVFSTVGFGDITATSQSARLVVTAQMIVDLLVLGLVVRTFVAAVQRARRQGQG
jgi:hypothetical protein